jgi:hypothetical protein
MMRKIVSFSHDNNRTILTHFQGGDVDKGITGLEKQANVMIDDLTWWTGALKAARER